MRPEKGDIIDLINGKPAAIKFIKGRRQKNLFLQFLTTADDFRFLCDLHVAAQNDHIHRQKLRPPSVAVRAVHGDMAHLDPHLGDAGKAQENPGAGFLAADDEGRPGHHDEAFQAPHEPQPSPQQYELVSRRDHENAPGIAEGAEKEICRHHDDEGVENGKGEADKDLSKTLLRQRKEAVNTKKDADQEQVHRHHLIVHVGGKLRRIEGQHRVERQIDRQRCQEQHPGEEHNFTKGGKFRQHGQHPSASANL